MDNIERLRLRFLDAKQKAEARYPGSFTAGPANYPVERHRKAWERVWRLFDELRTAEHVARLSEANRLRTMLMTEETNAIAGDFISKLKPLDIVTGRWTNCGSQYEATVRVKKVNARTIVCELYANVPEGYPTGQAFPFPKVGTTGNCLLPIED